MATDKKVKFGHIMLDIETLDNISTAVIVQIAAIEFDPITGKTGKSFSVPISIGSNLEIGRTVSESTILWWLKQDRQAIDNVFFTEVPAHIGGALSQFHVWFLHETEAKKDAQVWCKGAKFDFAILADAFRRLKMETPWSYRNENCLRTMLNRYPEAKKIKFKGVAHDALDDCKNQITQLKMIFNL